MIDTVLFDLDGTLIDSLPDIASAMNAALSELGYPTHDLDAYRTFVGRGADHLVMRAAPEEAVIPEQFRYIKDLYMRRYGERCTDQTHPYSGVTAGLKRLRDAGLKMAVVSNKPDAHTKTVTARYFGYDLFDLVVGSEAGYPRKPDPALPLHIIKSLGSVPERAAFVGDTKIDLDTSKACGTLFIGCAWGFHGRATLEAAGAERVAETFDEIEAMINALR